MVLLAWSLVVSALLPLAVLVYPLVVLVYPLVVLVFPVVLSVCPLVVLLVSESKNRQGQGVHF